MELDREKANTHTLMETNMKENSTTTISMESAEWYTTERGNIMDNGAMEKDLGKVYTPTQIKMFTLGTGGQVRNMVKVPTYLTTRLWE